MKPSVVIAPSAYKHGIGAEDMIHAWRQAMIIVPKDDGFQMIIGPAADGTLLEVGAIVGGDDGSTLVIIHAMPARRRFLPGR